jgi:regulator of ribonuclease activity A
MKTTDLCDEYGDQVSVADPIGFKHFGRPQSFYGQIATVKCYEDNSLVRAALMENGRGKLLVVDGGGSLRCALLGDMLAALAQKNEWSGLVIYGAVRDAEALAALDIGVMALATNPRRSAKNNEGTAGVPLHFAGVYFIPGRYLYADQDGIITSKREIWPL